MKIRDLNAESLYREFEFLGKRITEGFKRIETTKESIWAIHPKARGWFYGIFTVCRVVVSIFTVIIRLAGNRTRLGLIYSMRFGTELSVQLLFGLYFKQEM